MKKIICIIFFALALAACKTNDIVPESREYSYTFEIRTDRDEEPGNRAALGDKFIEWEDGDKIGTFAGGLNNNSGNITVADPCTFEVKTLTELSAGDKVYAYAPYSESAGTDPGAVKLVIPSEQSAEHISMPMAGVPYTVESSISEGTSAPVANMRFCNAASIARLLIYSDGTVASGEKILGVEVSSTTDICGSYSLDLSSVNPNSEESLALTALEGGKSINLSLAEASAVGVGAESAVQVPFVLAPGNHELTFVVTTDNSKYYKTSSEAIAFARNSDRRLKLDLSKANSAGITVSPSAIQSFGKGTSSAYTLSLTAASDASVSSCPEGWSAVIEGETLTVTAPSDDTHALEGNVVLSATTSVGEYVKEIPVRLAGINSKADFDAFADAMGRVEAAHVELIKDAAAYSASIAPYQIDGWVSLNTDISLTEEDFYNNYYVYILHHIYEPIDGNNHTINLNVQAKNTAGFIAFSQHIDKPVRNLNFAGSIVSNNLNNTGIAVLGIKLNNDITIENVNSSVNISVDKPAPYVSGLIAEFNGGASVVKGCTYSGTVTVNAAAQYIGGIVANNAAGKGEKQVTVQDCEFSGVLDYKSATHHAQPRIGGIMGSQERNGVVTGCINSGTMKFDLQGQLFATSDNSGIGGILGRCNGPADGYTMYTKLSDNAFTGLMEFSSLLGSQSKDYINKIIGTPLGGYDTENSVNNTETGSLNFITPSSEVSFASEETASFNYGETKSIEIIADETVTEVIADVPEGWTFDCTDFRNGITVTAPSDGKSAGIKGAAKIVLRCKDNFGNEYMGLNAKVFRLYGINDADELAAFTTVYGNTTDTPVSSGDAVAPYLVNGEITLNADITIPSGSVAWGAYWLKRIVIPLNGNGHTLTINTNQANRGGLCQNLAADVHDLDIAGRMETTGGTSISVMGGLACFISKNGVTIENVHSSVEMVYKSYVSGATAGYVAGLIGSADAAVSKPESMTIRNCGFSGSITAKNNAIAIGGIFGHAQAYGMQAIIEKCDVSANITAVTEGWACFVGGIVGCGGTATNPGEIMIINECTYSGTFQYKQNGQYYSRFGGIIGNLERGAEITDCAFTGKFLIDQNSKTSYSGNDRGVGGIIGREAAPNASYPNMNAKAVLTRCNSNGTIAITNSVDTADNNNARVRQISGCQLNTTSSHVETDCISNSTITFDYAQ